MILIGLGANLPSPDGPPEATLERALEALRAAAVTVAARSRWYRSAPVPPSGQPWYVNGVASLETMLPPAELLALLHRVEARWGRQRRERNAARPIDLDLLAYHDLREDSATLTLPHPRLPERAFVLLPLRDIAPGWRHPTLGLSVEALIARLPPDAAAEPLA